MAAPKNVKHLAGDTPKAAEAAYGDPAVPLDPVTILQVTLQLQNTVNDLVARFNALVTVFNAHVHTENTAGSYAQNALTAVPTTTGTAMTGAGSSAQNAFTAS